VNDDEAVARAIAFFQQTDDVAFLREVLRAVRPRAQAAAMRAEQQGKDAPPPAEIEPSAQPATPAEAMATVRATKDFGKLQALARAAGRRVEEVG